MRYKIQTWLAAIFLLIASPSVFGLVTELIVNEGPTPANAEDLQGPIAEAFPEKEVLPAGLWGKATGWLKNKDPFWSDMTLNGNFRTYYFLRDNGSTRLIEENEAWAAGGTLNFETGKLLNTISFGTEYFLSVPVESSVSTPGTGLLKPIQDTIPALGQAFIRGTFGEQIATAGRQRINNAIPQWQ